MFEQKSNTRNKDVIPPMQKKERIKYMEARIDTENPEEIEHGRYRIVHAKIRCEHI